MIIESTQGYCLDCDEVHPAWIERHGNEIFFRYQCEKKHHPYRISTNADLYLQLRAKSQPVSWASEGHCWVNLVEITKACNFQCPICYASAQSSTEQSSMKTVDEIQALGQQLRQKGMRTVCVTGGEPTLHPQLKAMIRSLRQLNLRVNMATNGYLLGTDQGLAQQLKRSGLSSAHIQFDTFNKEVHRVLRGNDAIDIKKQAIRNTLEAGLRLGLICTVTRDNLEEVPDLLQYALNYTPRLHTLVFQCAAEAGRFDYDRNHRVCREEVIEQIVQSRILADLTLDSFWPVPSYRPWKLALHCDCCALLILVKTQEGFIPLDHIVDMPRWYRMLHRNSMDASFYSKNVVTLWMALRCAQPSKRILLARALYGLMTGRTDYGFLFVSTEQFMHRDYIDIKRLQRCTAQVTDGPHRLKSPCLYGVPAIEPQSWSGSHVE